MKKSKWFECFNTNSSAKFRIFCFHHAGGSAAYFRDWGKLLHPDIEVLSMQLPGRDSRFTEPFRTDLDLVIRELFRDLIQLTDKPFMLFGHCLGALIAYELTRMLQNTDQAMPEHLYLSGRIAPHLKIYSQNIHDLSDSVFIKELSRYGGIPDEIIADQGLTNLLLPRFKADLTLAETYHYFAGTPLNCPMTVFGGQDDKLAGYEGLSAWKGYIKGDFRVHMTQGGHFFVNDSVHTILDIISESMRLEVPA